MIWLYRFIGVLFVLVIIALMGLLVVNAQTDGFGQSTLTLETAPIYAAILLAGLGVLLLVLFVFALLYRIVAWLWLRLAGQVGSFSIWHGLGAAAISLLLFPQAFNGLINVSFQMLRQFLIVTPRAIAQLVDRGLICVADFAPAGGQGPVDFSRCTSELLINTTTAISTSVNGLLFESGIAGLNFVTLCLAAIVFFGGAHAIRYFADNASGAVRFWFGYAAIAFVAIYLSLSATLAVALFSDTEEAAQLTGDSLRKQLGTLVVTETIEVQAAETVVLARAEDADAAALAAPESDILNAVKDDLWQFECAERELSFYVQEARAGSNEIAGKLPADAEKLVNSAVARFESERLVRRGEREGLQHYTALQDWFQRVLDEKTAMIAACDSAALSAQRSLALLASEKLRHAKAVREFYIYEAEQQAATDAALKAAANDPTGQMVLTSSAFAFPEVDWNLIDGVVEDAIQNWYACRPTDVAVIRSPPARPNFGSSLGSVGTATAWLLETESMPVTLITGLVGFGLLGALASRFVMPVSARRQQQAGEMTWAAEKGTEMATVVFGGFAAALVVYLGAYGGLAIASETGGDPNAYVVFAACLVGAAFSADVWEKARERFSDAIRHDHERAAGADAGSGQPTPDATTPVDEPGAGTVEDTPTDR